MDSVHLSECAERDSTLKFAFLNLKLTNNFFF